MSTPRSRPARATATGSIDPDGSVITTDGPVITTDGPSGVEIAVLAQPFLALDDAVPLLLFPVRVETRYRVDHDPPQLLVRIYPDQIHIQRDTPPATPSERELIEEFERELERATGAREQQTAWDRLTARVGTRRARRLLARTGRRNDRRRTRDGRRAREVGPTKPDPTKPDPTKPGDGTPDPTKPDPTKPGGGKPDWTKPDPTKPDPNKPDPSKPGDGTPGDGTADDRTTARAELLPRQWVVTGYAADGTRLFRVGSQSVATPLATGASATEPTWDVDASGIVVDDALAWMVDFARAEQAGMAVAIDLIGDAAPALDGVDTLLVVGVDSTLDADAGAERVVELFDAHAAADQFAFVAQGTPTNNMLDGESGWSAVPGPEPPPIVIGGRVAAVEEPPKPGGPLPTDVLTPDNAKRFARLLGLGDDEPWRLLEGGGEAEFLDARAMRIALFEVMFGTLVRELFKLGDDPAIGERVVGDLREWFVDHVVGGAPVPSIRVGAQPYGILPVQAPGTESEPSDVAAQVARIVGVMLPDWLAASAKVPSIDHGATDSSIDVATETAISTILATQPHPARILWRNVEAYESLNDLERLLTPQFLYELVLLSLSSLTNPALAAPFTHVADLYAALGGDSRNYEIEDQVALWADMEEGLAGWLSSESGSDPKGEGAAFIDTTRSLVEAYERRQHPLPAFQLDRRGVALAKRVIGDDGQPTAESPVNTTLVSAQFSGSIDEWGDLALVEAPGAPPEHSATTYLEHLRERFTQRHHEVQPPPLDDDFLASPPLLYQLISKSMFLTPFDEPTETEFEDALTRLSTIDPDRLEWLLRETLGLGTHRLDAWHTSLAAARLDTLRADRAEGLNVGAFGLVTDLKRSDATEPSQGFVHAPSLGQAATAAILRCGYQAHGSSDAASAFAVDLSSRRTRDAQWLLAGVSRGQPLGELLGCRFERMLHDAALDHLIRPTREAVLAAHAHPEGSADEPVDGIDLLEFVSDERVTLDPAAGGVLTSLKEAFDAANDLAVAEGVHQLTSGSYARASAMLDAVATGTSRAPDAEVVSTVRSGIAVEHRLALILPATPKQLGGWTNGLRDQAAPQLEWWVRGLLPSAADVGFATVDEAGITVLDLATLELGALDAIHLCSEDPGQASGALTTLLASSIGSSGSIAIDPRARGDRPCSLAEFGVLATELRRLIDAARPGDARDLRPAADPGDQPAASDAWDGVLDALQSELASASDALAVAIDAADTARLAPAIARLARFGFACPGPVDDLDASRRMLGLVEARQRKLLGRLSGTRPIDRPNGGDGNPKSGIDRPPIDLPPIDMPILIPPTFDERVSLLFGHRLPLMPVFEADAAVSALPDRSLATADELDAWIDAVARVRPTVGQLAHVGLLSAALGGSGLSLLAGQYPSAPGGPWAASTRPSTAGTHVCVTAAIGAEEPDDAAPICALMLDRWVERIPSPEQTTGVAFHFDAPTNQAPQVCLLQVLPNGGEWTLDVVHDTVLTTLDWVRTRAVAPEELAIDGRTVPSIYVPGTITPWNDDTPVAAAARGGAS